jgi:hypothetical protein
MSSRSLHRTLEISGLLLVLAALAAYPSDIMLDTVTLEPASST